MYSRCMRKIHGHAIARDIAGAIRQRLSVLHISQWELANALGVSQGSLSQWLRGVAPMPEGMEARIHAALDALEEEQLAAEAVEKLRAERAAQDADGERLSEIQELRLIKLEEVKLLTGQDDHLRTHCQGRIPPGQADSR